ncbi:CCN family member 5-like [Diretmus argenteus]
MDRRDNMLLGCFLLCIITQVWCQLCAGPCQCPAAAPRCPVGVPLVLDGCQCCQVCARQEGEACTDRLPCDTQRGLQCDHSASYPGGPGECVGQNDLGCELNGVRLGEGQTFQPSCAQLCHCLGGGVTCVPLCTDDLNLPSTSCPNPQLLRLPGRCCKEWVCDSSDNSIYPDSSAANVSPFPVESVERARQNYGSSQSVGLISNCIEHSTDWSPCSRSCGPGVSIRSSNKNWACRLQTQTRLCQVRPCQVLALGPRGLQPGSGACESRSALSIHLEHQGCVSTRAYRPRFCGLACPDGRCCSPYHTRTVPMAFRCPQGRLIQQQVMVIESCACSTYNCPQASAAWRVQLWL